MVHPTRIAPAMAMIRILTACSITGETSPGVGAILLAALACAPIRTLGVPYLSQGL